MAWKTVDLQEQRVRFVVMAAGKSQSFSSLCAAFGISRPTGYLWRVAAPFNVGDPQSLNLYAYVRNNPENMIDPSGLCAEGIGSDQCRGFEFVIFWGWGSGRDSGGGYRGPRRLPRHKPIPSAARSEIRSSAMTTERHEVQITVAVAAPQ